MGYVPHDGLNKNLILCEVNTMVISHISRHERDRVLKYYNGENMSQHIPIHLHPGTLSVIKKTPSSIAPLLHV